MTIHDIWLLKNLITEESKATSEFPSVSDNRSELGLNFFINNIHSCLFPSDHLKSLFVRHCGQNSRFVNFPTGIEFDDAKNSRTTEYQKDTKLTFAYFGRVRASKGVKTLCEAFADLSNRGAKLQIHGPFEKSFEAEAKKFKDVATIVFFYPI